jgi:hypothetical protein
VTTTAPPIAAPRRAYLHDRNGAAWSWPLPSTLSQNPAESAHLWCEEIEARGGVEVVLSAAETTLTYRPDIVTPAALVATKLFLHGAPLRPVKIRKLEMTARESLHASPTHAAAWLVAHESCDPFKLRKRRLGELAAEDSDPRLAALLSHWQQQGGKFEPGYVTLLQRLQLFERSTIVSKRPGEYELMVEHMGYKLKIHPAAGADYNMRISLGRPPWATVCPDSAYYDFCERAYRNVMTSGRPSFATVDCLVHARLDQPWHSRVDRILLPWTTRDGSIRITSTTLPTARFAA